MDRQLHVLQSQEEALQTRVQALERRIIQVSPWQLHDIEQIKTVMWQHV